MIEAYFDGLCEPRNPGGVATYGYVIYREGRKIHEGRGVAGTPNDPSSTNNVAEYTGIVRAMEHLVAEKLTGEPVVIRGDSQLVIRQATGEWKVKSRNLAALNARVRELFFEFKELRFEWIPREKNREADALTHLAYAEFPQSK